MALNFGKKVKAGCTIVAVIAVAIAAATMYMLPGQISTIAHEPRYVPALVVACVAFQRLPILTVRQKMFFRYRIRLGLRNDDLKVSFVPRQPNDLTTEQAELPRQAWGAHVIINRHTFRVVRWYLDPD